MKRIRNDRARRAMTRDRDHRAERDAAAWLASLTPEHRAVHEQGRICGECMDGSFRRLGRLLRGETS